ncbi:leptin receptor gene-related protein-like [Saccoglossus kowalevskii]|uniref:Leptin receptor gene-related protein-like n=1 Tax=Saccoglossus kowalevskii TaxID=10224 RepID=A0ABM0GZR2_SACKO|nr:PREDICTED: leptin receptor gene-related protein-like [Saccoglossus kowalevskii]
MDLIILAFSLSCGLTLVVLGCALKPYGEWWPMFVLFFYVLSPIPTVIARRYAPDLSSGASSACIEYSIFFTTGIVVSAYGLPLVLAHTEAIKWGAAGLTLAGNTVSFFTILAYFIIFNQDEDFEFSVF